MTTKLKNLKDAPLLTPPGQSKWWDITERDRQILRDYIEGEPRIRTESDFATLYYVVKLGLRDGVTQRWKEFAASMIPQHREARHWTPLAKLHYLVKDLGLQQEVLGRSEIPEADVEMISGSPKGTGGLGTSIETAYYVKALGLPLTITDDVKERMRHELETETPPIIPWKWFEALVMLDKLGLLGDVTGQEKIRMEDVEVVRNKLNEFRKRGEGWGVAMIHHTIRMIMPPEETQENQPVPPIRRFKG